MQRSALLAIVILIMVAVVVIVVVVVIVMIVLVILIAIIIALHSNIGADGRSSCHHDVLDVCLHKRAS